MPPVAARPACHVRSGLTLEGESVSDGGDLIGRQTRTSGDLSPGGDGNLDLARDPASVPGRQPAEWRGLCNGQLDVRGMRVQTDRQLVLKLVGHRVEVKGRSEPPTVD